MAREPLRTPEGVFPEGLPEEDLSRGSNVIARGTGEGDVDVFVYQARVTPTAVFVEAADRELEVVAAFRISAPAFETLFGVEGPQRPSELINLYVGS